MFNEDATIMKIIPFQMLVNVPTGNPYIGRHGFVDLGPKQSTMDVAELFPFHLVDNGSLKNIRSHILKNQIRIGYFDNNQISEIEIMSPFEDTHLVSLSLGNCSLFSKTLLELKVSLEDEGFKLEKTNVGFDLEDHSVSFYSNSYENDLNVALDTVVVRFKKL